MKIPVDKRLVKHSALLTVCNLYEQTLTASTQLLVLKMSYSPINKSLRLFCRYYDPFKFTGCYNHKWCVASQQSIPSGCQSSACVSPSLSNAFNRALVSLITRTDINAECTFHTNPSLWHFQNISFSIDNELEIPIILQTTELSPI